MDADFDRAAALRGIYRSAPGGAWRLYRRELALLIAGEAALFSRTWGRWGQYNGLRRGVAVHEVGHSIASMVLTGRPLSTALTSAGGLAGGGITSQEDAEGLVGTGKSDTVAAAPYVEAIDFGPERAERLRWALVRLFQRPCYSEALTQLSMELENDGFIHESRIWDFFHPIPAAAELAPAPGAPAESGSGAGKDAGVLRGVGGGAPGAGTGTEGAGQVHDGGTDEDGPDPAGKMD